MRPSARRRGPGRAGRGGGGRRRGEFDLDAVADEEPARRGRRSGSPRRPAAPPPARPGRPWSGPRAEPQAGRDVDDQPEAQRPLLDVAPDERPSLPGRDVPVEVPDVVARLVRRSSAKVRPARAGRRGRRPASCENRLGPDPEPQPTRPSDDRPPHRPSGRGGRRSVLARRNGQNMQHSDPATRRVRARSTPRRRPARNGASRPRRASRRRPRADRDLPAARFVAP